MAVESTVKLWGENYDSTLWQHQLDKVDPDHRDVFNWIYTGEGETLLLAEKKIAPVELTNSLSFGFGPRKTEDFYIRILNTDLVAYHNAGLEAVEETTGGSLWRGLRQATVGALPYGHTVKFFNEQIAKGQRPAADDAEGARRARLSAAFAPKPLTPHDKKIIAQFRKIITETDDEATRVTLAQNYLDKVTGFQKKLAGKIFPDQDLSAVFGERENIGRDREAFARILDTLDGKKATLTEVVLATPVEERPLISEAEEAYITELKGQSAPEAIHGRLERRDDAIFGDIHDLPGRVYGAYYWAFKNDPDREGEINPGDHDWGKSQVGKDAGKFNQAVDTVMGEIREFRSKAE